MSVARPLGLALSGGGFRATAFHLGVMKRLRELGLLENVDIVSTVSGGSIAGAYWVYWQAKRGDTLRDAAEWARFEASLIHFMLSGVRESVVWRGFWVPLLVLVGLAGAAAAYTWKHWQVWPRQEQFTAVFAVVLAIGFAAYASWHYRASKLIQRRLDRVLFKRTTFNDLSPSPFPHLAKRRRQWPHLFVNATGLNSGDALLFTAQPSIGSPA